MKSKIPKPPLKDYVVLLLRPVIIGVIGVIIWYILRRTIMFEITREDIGVFEPLLGIIGVAHGYLAASQIQKVSTQHQRIELALDRKDVDMFDECAYNRIHPVIKLLLGVFSIVFIWIFLLYPFEKTYSGVVVVWTTMFILYLLWEIAAELDDPFHGIWHITPERLKEIFGEDYEKK